MAQWWSNRYSNRFSKALSEYSVDYNPRDDVDQPLTTIEEEGESKQELPVKKSWARRLNPLISKTVPPIPEFDAGLVPEVNANWFSKLTWGWISPLMMVAFPFET